MTDRLDAVEPDARDLIEAVRLFVSLVGIDVLQVRSHASDAEQAIHAVKTVAALLPDKLQPLIAAHDAFAAALNAACPDAPPIASISTEGPAELPTYPLGPRPNQ